MPGVRPGYESDILASGLDVIFCGVNPALTAAVDGHNFSNRSNRFWPVLHLAVHRYAAASTRRASIARIWLRHQRSGRSARQTGR